MNKNIYLSRIFLLFTFCFLLFTSIASAKPIEGGVTYTVDSARQYLQEGLPQGINIPDKYYQVQTDNIDKMVTSYNNNGEVVGVTVQYINEPTKAYIYKRGNLTYVEYYDKPVSIFPHRGYRYNLDGGIVSSSLSVSKNESFRFDSKGKLIAHSVNGIIYDENQNVIGSGK